MTNYYKSVSEEEFEKMQEEVNNQENGEIGNN